MLTCFLRSSAVRVCFHPYSSDSSFGLSLAQVNSTLPLTSQPYGNLRHHALETAPRRRARTFAPSTSKLLLNSMSVRLIVFVKSALFLKSALRSIRSSFPPEASAPQRRGCPIRMPPSLMGNGNEGRHAGLNVKASSIGYTGNVIN